MTRLPGHVRKRLLFDRLVEAACAGARCPTDPELDGNGKLVGALARDGHIRSEIYARNYRVIKILTGPHAGKRTAPDPRGGKPYRILDKNGDRWLTRSKEQGPPIVQHVDHLADRGRPGAPATLPKLSFLEGDGQ